MRIGNRVLVDAAVDEGRHHRLHGFQIIFQSIFGASIIRLELAGVDEEPPEAPVPPPLVHSREDLPALSCDEQNTSSSVQLPVRCENKNKLNLAMPWAHLPVFKTRRHTNCTYDDKNKLTATKALSSRSSSGIVLEVSAPATRHPSAPLTALASRTRTTASSVRLPKASPVEEAPAFPFVLTSPEIDASPTSSLLCDRKASHRSARSVSSVTYIGALRLYASTCSGLTCDTGRRDGR